MYGRIIALFLALFLSVSPVYGQVSDAMNDFFDDSKGYKTSTPSGHYEGQTRGVYTLGSFSYRQDQKTYQLASVQLPKLKSGCGGIDIFKGGFSYLDGEQLKAMMRNIIQNATTYAFKLAIDTVSPLIGKNMGELQTWVQRINGFNINSCETAMAAVDTVVAGMHQAVGTTCQQMGAAKGIYSDSIKGRMNCKDEADDVLKTASGNAEKMNTVVNRNYSYDATSSHSLYSSDEEMREFLMSVSGTLVTTIDSGTDGPDIKIQYVPPIALDDGVVETLMSGGTLRIHRCVDDDCLDVQQYGKSVTIPASDGFRVKVDNMLSSIYRKVSGANSSALTAEEKAFINETTIPIHKAVDVYSQLLPGTGESQVRSYSDLIAYDMVLKFLIDQQIEVQKGANTVTGGEGQTFESWRAGVDTNIQMLADLKQGVDDKFAASVKFIEHVQSMEQQVAAKLITVANNNSASAPGGR